MEPVDLKKMAQTSSNTKVMKNYLQEEEEDESHHHHTHRISPNRNRGNATTRYPQEKVKSSADQL